MWFQRAQPDCSAAAQSRSVRAPVMLCLCTVSHLVMTFCAYRLDVRHDRWFSAGDVAVSEAKFLDVILYSAEQLAKEYLAMPSADRGDRKEPPAAPWGIISVKAQVSAWPESWQPEYVT